MGTNPAAAAACLLGLDLLKPPSSPSSPTTTPRAAGEINKEELAMVFEHKDAVLV